MRWLICLLLVAAPLGAGADIYRYTTDDGRVVYSDEPRPGSEKVDVGAPSVYEAPPPGELEDPPERGDKPEGTGYASFRIVRPQSEATVWDTNGRVAVELALEPSLKADDRIVVALDGEPIDQELDGALRFDMAGIDRGAHTVRAWIEGPSGTRRIATESVTFHMKTHQVQDSKRDPQTGRQPYVPPTTPPGD